MNLKVGDVVRFSKTHREKPGIGYVEGWSGLIVEKVTGPHGKVEELLIWWDHGSVSDYPSSWWNALPYEPFEVINESR